MSDVSTPLVSVITVVYNGAATIEHAIRSVLDQPFGDFEYIVIDGGSSDGTVDIVNRYRSRIAHFVSEPDGGIYAAWNKGLRAARGQWIAFLGADDRYEPGALQRYAEVIRGFGDEPVDYVSSRVAFVKDDKVVRVYGGPWQWPLFAKTMNVGHVGSLHHRRLYERHGEYDESYRVCGDYEFLLRSRGALRTSFFPEITAAMSVGGASNRQLKRVFAEMARAKTEAGGRPRLVASLESAWGYAKARVRAVLWY